MYPDYTGVLTNSLFSSGGCIPLDTPIMATLTTWVCSLMLCLVLMSVFRFVTPVRATLTSSDSVFPLVTHVTD